MLRLDKVIKPWNESAALSDHISLYGFWNETTFLTKSGDESWIRAGTEDNLCVNITTLAFSKADGMTDGKPPQPVCGTGKVPASQAYSDQHLYDALIDAFSMRGFVPSNGNTGHDHFFDTFSKFAGTSPLHVGEWLDEVAGRAQEQNEQYLELMLTPPSTRTSQLAKDVGWLDDFARLRDELLSRGLRDDIAVAQSFLDQAEATRSRRENCGLPEAKPACRVQIRYIYQVARGAPKEQVFAQTLLGFEVAAADKRVVAINYVQAEDGLASMTNYESQMMSIGFLRDFYPTVHTTLHAGELTEGLVPPAGLCCHIRLAVERAHAERIGHGVDVMSEERPYDLLKEMSSKHILVEINLTSNEVILGVKGKHHPFAIYREHDVPVALSTDDEGVSRIDLTHEYVRAAEEYGLNYAEMKRLARNSLEYSFLPGPSLWRQPNLVGQQVRVCRDEAGSEKPSAECSAFLNSSEKALQQWELEKRFHAFESKF